MEAAPSTRPAKIVNVCGAYGRGALLRRSSLAVLPIFPGRVFRHEIRQASPPHDAACNCASKERSACERDLTRFAGNPE